MNINIQYIHPNTVNFYFFKDVDTFYFMNIIEFNEVL